MNTIVKITLIVFTVITIPVAILAFRWTSNKDVDDALQDKEIEYVKLDIAELKIKAKDAMLSNISINNTLILFKERMVTKHDIDSIISKNLDKKFTTFTNNFKKLIQDEKNKNTVTID